MNRLQRRLIFYIFVLAFFIGAPSIVLYTAGYRLDPINRSVTLRTGGLAISTIPRRAQISLNEVETSRRSPHIFQQLAPGDYVVELNRAGFLTWSGEIEIEPGLTSYIQDILLLRDEEPEFLQNLPTDDFSIDPTGRRLAYTTEQGGWIDLWLLDLNNAQVENISRLSGEEAEMEIHWSQNGNYLAWRINEDLKVFNRRGQRLNLQSLPQTIKGISWHPSREEALLIQAERLTIEISVTSGQIVELSAGTIIRLDNDRALLAREAGESTILTLEEDGRQIEVAALPVNNYQIFTWQNPFLILQNDQGKLTSFNVNNGNWRILDARASHSDWLAEQLSMAFTDGNEIIIYNAIQNTQELVDRLSSNISHIAWHNTGSRIFYTDKNRVFAIDAFRFTKQRNNIILAEFDEIKDMWISANGRNMYLVGQRNSLEGLFSLRLR